MVAPIRLTPQKQQERRSIRQIADCFEAFGWVVTPPSEDLGEDSIVHIYFDGRATGVLFHVQAKSITNLQKRKRKDYLPYPFDVKDLNHWSAFALPVVLLAWDINQKEGRWILVKEAIFQLEKRNPRWQTQKTATIYIPWNNTANDLGLKHLRQAIGHQLAPQLTHGKALEGNLVLKFPNDPRGSEALKQFKAYLQEGQSVTLLDVELDQPLVKTDPQFGALIQKLYEIQKWFKRPLQLPAKGFSLVDANDIVGLWDIIKTGKTKTFPEYLTLTVEPAAADFDLFLRLYKEQESQNNTFTITRSDSESGYEILGKTIETGALIQHIHCKARLSYQELLEKLSQHPSGELLELKFTDVVITDIYLDFYWQEAQRLAALIQTKYAVDTIYLFGSLALNQGFTPETDIDLAIDGVSDQDCTDLLDYLEQETQFAMNIVELEYTPAALRKRILEEGVKLYESQF
jgi:predicted nucleotidyltransferase